MRIAILILMHEYTDLQRILIDHLSRDFDLYIHVDKKTKIDIDLIRKQNVYVFKRFKVYWGSLNQIRATILLLQEAKRLSYDRYIIISGSDFPIKSNSEIIEFFKKHDEEYLEYFRLPYSGWRDDNGGLDRIDFFYTNAYRKSTKRKVAMYASLGIDFIDVKIVIPMLKRMHVHRKRMKMPYFGGSNWMNLSNHCVDEILKFIRQNPWYIRRFRYTRCADEIFFQTILCNFAENIKINNDNLRYIDWANGPEKPRILRINDLEKLKESKCLFARKFDLNVDMQVVNKLAEMIVEQGQ